MIKSESTNWKRGLTKPYQGKIKDETGYVEIAYTGSFGKREKVTVSPDKVQIKFNSLLQQGKNPFILP
jgi:hypothetical protein